MFEEPTLYEFGKNLQDSVVVDGKPLLLFTEYVKNELARRWSSLRLEKLNRVTVRKIVKEIIPAKLFVTKAEKQVRSEYERSIFAAIVWKLSHLGNFHELIINMDAFLRQNPRYKGLDSVERSYLLKFRNAMCITSQIIAPSHGKCLMIDICAKFEGSGNHYITGGGQTSSTQRRSDLFHLITGLPLQHRPARYMPAESSIATNTSRKRRRRADYVVEDMSEKGHVACYSSSSDNELTDVDFFSDNDTWLDGSVDFGQQAEYGTETDGEVAQQPRKRPMSVQIPHIDFYSVGSSSHCCERSCNVVSAEEEQMLSPDSFDGEIDYSDVWEALLMDSLGEQESS